MFPACLHDFLIIVKSLTENPVSSLMTTSHLCNDVPPQTLNKPVRAWTLTLSQHNLYYNMNKYIYIERGEDSSCFQFRTEDETLIILLVETGYIMVI